MPRRKRLFVLALAAALSPAASGRAAGLLRPIDAAYRDLEIREHKVRVLIRDGFAKTQVDQVFHNPNARDLEARYAFPVPERAAMSELSLWIDGKEIQGEVLARKEAQAAYEEERRQGRSAALNEKQGYHAFEVRVSPVRAGGETRVRLVYYQPLQLDHGVGRYVYALEEGGTDDARRTAFFTNELVTGESSFAIDVALKTSSPIEELLIPAHPEALIEKDKDGGFRVRLQKPGPARLDKDFVLNYRLAADRPPGAELIPYREPGSKEGSFLLTVTPGDAFKTLEGGADWTFVLDVSGSMKDKLAALMDGVEKSIGRLRPQDRFRIALFSDHARWLISAPTEANAENVAGAAGLVRGLKAEGGTDLHAGLSLALADIDSKRTQALLVVTDGVVNSGVTDPQRMLELLRTRDLRLFTFVLGNSANRPLLEDLARASGGFAMSLSNSDAIVGQILMVQSKLSHEALHDVRVELDGAQILALTPARPRPLYRGDQLRLFGRYRGQGAGNMTLHARSGGRPVKITIPVNFPEADARSPEIERLWALARIEELELEKRLGGDAGELENAIRELAVRHSLVTDYTAMVVLGEERFAARGIPRDNQRRVSRERAVQATQTAQAPPRYREKYSPSRGWELPVPNLGGGCAGPAFALFSAALAGLGARRRRR